jgi:hypothetical protein
VSYAVALASQDTRAREALAQYLKSVGFTVKQYGDPPRALPGWSLVWLTERESDSQEIERTLEAWLDEPEVWRVVVVTWRPAALRSLGERHGVRLAVLVPPVFGWNVADPLRGTDGGPEAA